MVKRRGKRGGKIRKRLQLGSVGKVLKGPPQKVILLKASPFKQLLARAMKQHQKFSVKGHKHK